MTKYLVLSREESAYFVTQFLSSTEKLLDILPTIYRDSFVLFLQQPSRLMPREIFIKEGDLWHRVLDAVWFPSWEDWVKNLPRWYPNKELNYYIEPVDEVTRTHCCEVPMEGWFVELTQEELEELSAKYTATTYTSDQYKQNDEFLTILVVSE